MKILLDTNVIISSIIFGGRSRKLLTYLLNSEHELYVSEYIDAEFKEKLLQKWPTKADLAYQLFHQMNIHFVKSTDIPCGELRDIKDIPVLSDARFHHIDVILTGDKDFLEADLDSPIILTPSMMMEYFGLS